MSDLSKQNASTLNWAMRGAVGALFTVIGILYWNERDARMELATNLKETVTEMSEIESDFQEFQKSVIRDYVSNSDFEEQQRILLNINSNISEVVERLIKLETKFEIKDN